MLISEWAQDHTPLEYKPGLPAEALLNPPIIAVLFAPAAWLPWEDGVPAVIVLNYLALLCCLLLLFRMAAPIWSIEARLLFGCYVLLLPAVHSTFNYGQSTLVICACVAATLYALSRKRDGWAGVFLALSLAKFTLAFPFLVLTAYRRRWKAATVAVGLFIGINTAFALPVGIPKMLSDYQYVIHTTTLPGGVNDPGTRRFLPFLMVDARRLFFWLFAPDRSAAEGMTLLFTLCAVGGLAYLFRPRPRQPEVFAHPLEISLAMLAGLTLFYHRVYDLAALMFVAYGLLDYHLRWPQRQPVAWKVNVAALLFLSYATFHVWPFTLLDVPLLQHGLASRPYYTCLLVMLVFLLQMGLYYQDQRQYEAETQTAGSKGLPSAVPVNVLQKHPRLKHRRNE